MQFTKASKTSAKLRLALMGPAGSGKTYTALKIATALSSKVALIDTEYGSASKYADEFSFDTVQLKSFSPEMYVAALTAAERGGYEVVIVDSLSHAWTGKDGALEMADREQIKSKSNNKFFAWRNVTPVWQSLLDRMQSLDIHLIGTLRSKTEYLIEKDDQGKNVPQKVGLAPIFRDGSEYEFDVVGELNLQHQLIIGKTRCRPIDGLVINKPGAEFAEVLRTWLKGVEPEPPKAKKAPSEAPATEATTPQSTQSNSRLISPTMEIERLGRDLYHDMWEEKSEEIAWWASGRRTNAITDLTNEEKSRVLAGMQEKIKKAA